MLKKNWKFIVGLVFALLISVGIFIFRDQIAGLKGYGYLGLFLLNVLGSATIFLPTPLFLTAFAMGAVLNPLVVALIASLGSAIGELTGYFVGLVGGAFVENDRRAKKINGWMDKYGGWTLFFLAAIPNPIFDIAGFVAGATKVPVSKYLMFVWLGKIVKFGVISYLGAGSSYVFAK